MAERLAEVGRWQNVLRRRHGSKFAQLDGAYAPRKQALATAPKGNERRDLYGAHERIAAGGGGSADLARLYRTLTLDSVALAEHPADRSSASAPR